MKHLNKVLVATLISGGLLGSAFVAQAGSNDKDSKEVMAMSETSITMNKALEIALSTVPGTAKSVEFDLEKGKTIWEVEVVDANKKVHELEIDATSGKVLKQKLDDDNDDNEKHRKNKKHDDKD